MAVAGIAVFSRFGNVLAQRPISRDPLSGVVDGQNKVFHTNFYPMLTTGSLVVKAGVNLATGTADYGTGEIELDQAPAVQPVATYTFTPYTPTQIAQFLFGGFDEMELRWLRNYRLVDGSGNPASESSAAILVVDSDGADPPFGSFTFSASRAQIAFLMLCAEYRMYSAEAGNAAINDFSFREQLRGMAVDKSQRPKNLEALLARLEKRLALALDIAQSEFFDGSQFGAGINNPITYDYLRNFEWQESSKAMDYVGQLPYNYSQRIF